MPGREVFGGELIEDALPIERGTGVVPGDGLDRRLVELRVVEVLGVDLFDASEAAELALDTVEIAVMIAVGAGESGFTPLVLDRDAADTMDREREPRDPGAAGSLVVEIEACRGRVFDGGGGAEVVVDLDE